MKAMDLCLKRINKLQRIYIEHYLYSVMVYKIIDTQNMQVIYLIRRCAGNLKKLSKVLTHLEIVRE